tara:strand:+ start:167 stop:1111 length:945 start_codon:yes stop_codon:yes gene_type:complete
MIIKPIIIVAGEPKSIFFEIFFKTIGNNNFKSPLVLIASLKILKSQIKKFKLRKKIELIELNDLNKIKLNNKSINLIDIPFNSSKKSNLYVNDCFEIAFRILKKGITNKFLNGPIKKSKFFNKKFLGMTEYISYKFKVKKNAMLIYNEKLSVCPITTHLPLKLVSKKINQKIIKEKTILINNFYKEILGFKPKIAVTGLNPHCETILQFDEDNKILYPAIKSLRKKGFNITGPFSADTIFLRQNRVKYDVILGMYHDQVLSPMKALMEYDALNITLGLPFLRVSPDHGTNEKMINKNLSNPLSLIKALKFLDKK